MPSDSCRYSATHKQAAESQKRQSNSEWTQAAQAAPLSYAEHWRTFEAMLRDCTDPSLTQGEPCFNWRTPTGKVSPTQRTAVEHCGGGHRTTVAAPALAAQPVPLLAMPANGTLSAAVECVHQFARQLAAQPLSQRPSGGAAARAVRAAGTAALAASTTAHEGAWGVLVLGDAPGYISLVKSLPALRGRVVDTNDAGEVAHTTFTGSCAPGSPLCVQAGTHNPQGGWTRAMVDYYIGGLTDGFVSSLFSSFVGAVLRRSLLCCKQRMHFGAMYSQQHSHRDKPMRNVAFLKSLMQKSEVDTDEKAWAAH